MSGQVLHRTLEPPELMATPKYSYSYANARGSSPEVTQALSAPALFFVLKLRENSSLDSTDLS